MSLQAWAPYLSAIEIILAITLTVLVLLQTKGSDLGGFMGGSGDMSGSSYLTKRGAEMIIHRVTIWLSVAFFVVTLFCFIALGQST